MLVLTNDVTSGIKKGARMNLAAGLDTETRFTMDGLQVHTEELKYTAHTANMPYDAMHTICKIYGIYCIYGKKGGNKRPSN